ncbi:MAG: leucine-rich repeat domain-containing protein [Eggerthellaceae bacterium]|nr:leucine-rich repeat domain-containing protein [Eggerthellaceae bacterium]
MSSGPDASPDRAIIGVDVDGVRFDAHVLDDGTACIDACITEKVAIVFPDSIDDHIVSKLGSHVCREVPNLASVVLPTHLRELGEHSFDFNPKLFSVTFNEGLEQIGGHSFSNAAIVKFTAPESLRVLGAKAFFHCSRLTSVTLNEGLERIGEGAFFETGIHELHVPGTVTMIGREIVGQTSISNERYAGSITLGEGSPFVIDAQGGFYRKVTKGLVMLEALNHMEGEHSILPGTIRIADRAFLYHPALERVTLPEGLVSIGNSAFKYCRKLRIVDVPESLESLGDEAFRSTMLECFRIPVGFRFMGAFALSTCSYGNSLSQPTLTRVDIDPANPSFYMESGLLCRRDDDGDHAIVYVGPDIDVTIPSQVRHLDIFCFAGVGNIEHLTVHTDIEEVALGAFFTATAVPRVTINERDPLGNEHTYEAYFSSSSYSAQCFSQAFGGPSNISIDADGSLVLRRMSGTFELLSVPKVMDPASIFDFADLSIRHCYRVAERKGLILLRLSDGSFLSKANREMFVESVKRNLDAFVTACSQQNNVEFIKMLIVLGFIHEGNITKLIDLLGSLDDVKLVSYLLNVQHERFPTCQYVVEDL